MVFFYYYTDLYQIDVCKNSGDIAKHNTALENTGLLVRLIKKTESFSAKLHTILIFWKVQNMENIEAKVKKVVADKLGIDEATIKDDASFIEDLGADSLDTVELVMALEEEFGCEIPDEEAEKITTVQKAIDYIKAHV